MAQGVAEHHLHWVSSYKRPYIEKEGCVGVASIALLPAALPHALVRRSMERQLNEQRKLTPTIVGPPLVVLSYGIKSFDHLRVRPRTLRVVFEIGLLRLAR